MTRLIPLFSFFIACASAGGLPTAAIDHNREGAHAFASGDLDTAEASFRLALEYHPRFAEPHANLGLVMLRRGDVRAAEDHLRTAIELNADFDEAWANLGVVLLRIGEVDDAIEAFEAALAIDPGLQDARSNLATTWMKQERFAEARAQWMRLLQQNQTPRTRAMLAYCELRLERFEAAREQAEQALRDAPGEPVARVVRGVLHAREGRFHSSIEDLVVAQDDPVVGFDARLRLAAVEMARGNRVQARMRIRALRDEAPRHPAVVFLAAQLSEP